MASKELRRYGWDEEWAASFQLFVQGRPGQPLPGRVIRHHGVAVDIITTDGVRSMRLRRGLGTAPVVGDWVALDRTILGVLPRATLLERQSARQGRRHALVANIDQVMITCGVDRPLNAGRIQRSITVSTEAGAEPIVVVTKTDLATDSTLTALRAQLDHDHPGVPVITTSVVSGTGLPTVLEQIGTTTVALLGESGSEKSSLINALHGTDVAETGTVRPRDNKGRHTTTARALHPLPGGGAVVDTPGLRSLGLPAGTTAVETTFDDITELAEGCRFRDCAHAREPGCAVRAAIDEGHLDPRRLEAYHRLAEEATD